MGNAFGLGSRVVNKGGKTMGDDHRIIIHGNVTNAQVGQTLTNCTNMIQQQAPGERRERLEALRGEVAKLIESLPEAKKAEGQQVAENLEMLVKQATSGKPNRKWYDLSAEGLLEAASWVGDFSTRIGGALESLGKLVWPG